MVRKKGSRAERLSWSQKVTESSEMGDNVCIKLGRFLDERDDIVPKSILSSKATRQCPFLSGDLAAQIIEKSTVEELFDEFNRTSLAALHWVRSNRKGNSIWRSRFSGNI
jgi:hypothetical protein